MAHPTPPSSAAALRVLSVNVHKGFSFLKRRFVLRELRDAVRATGADLVFLQEVRGVHQGTELDMPQYEFLADQIWPAFAYGRNAVYTHGDHGNALLSKHSIVRVDNVDVSAATHERRGLLHCVLQLPGRLGVLHAICVHLGLRQSHRGPQLRQLCEHVARRVPPSEPLLVAGDFNDWRGKAHAVLHECAGLVEVFVEAQGRAARSFPARLPLLPLDRIYVRGVREHRPVRLPARPWNVLSDHAPVAAEIEL